MSNVKKLMMTAAGSDPLDIDNIFSIFLYEGNGSQNLAINNGIDLAGEGGMVWYRRRDAAENNSIEDTVRGLDKVIYTDSNNTQADPGAYGLQAFNSNGFTAGYDTSGGDYVSWTFRKSPNFFDIVTYTGTGSARTINHSLGSVPGMIWIKNLSRSESWSVYHRSTGATKHLKLNNQDYAYTDSGYFNDTTPTASVFSLGNNGQVNEDGDSYVAYLFAHNNNDGTFGPNSDQDIIKCGTYTGSGSTEQEIDLGFEPQLVIIKKTSSSGSGGAWNVFDEMRGFYSDTSTNRLTISSSYAEYETDTYHAVGITNKGFKLTRNENWYNYSGYDYIYMAIRRGPLAVPTDSSNVFALDTQSAAGPATTSGFKTDAKMRLRTLGGSAYPQIYARKTGIKGLTTSSSDEQYNQSNMEWDFMNGAGNDQLGGTSTNIVAPMWRRAPSYFDVVTYAGSTTTPRTIAHNLGVAPEMIWLKGRDAGGGVWYVYHKDRGNQAYSLLNTGDSYTSSDGVIAQQIWNNTAPTASVFSLGNAANGNANGQNFIAYLFATAPGVSKVGSYTGDGTTDGSKIIDCGFSNGPKFVIVQGSGGDFMCYDTTRGLVAGNDHSRALNSSVVDNSGFDVIDPHSTGFAVLDNGGTFINENGYNYIFYAVAA